MSSPIEEIKSAADEVKEIIVARNEEIRLQNMEISKLNDEIKGLKGENDELHDIEGDLIGFTAELEVDRRKARNAVTEAMQDGINHSPIYYRQLQTVQETYDKVWSLLNGVKPEKEKPIVEDKIIEVVLIPSGKKMFVKDIKEDGRMGPSPRHRPVGLTFTLVENPGFAMRYPCPKYEFQMQCAAEHIGGTVVPISNYLDEWPDCEGPPGYSDTGEGDD